MKCWEDRGLYDGPKNFDPLEFLAKIKVDNYRWDRLKLQVSQHAWIEPAVLVKSLRERFSFLGELTTSEQELCDDRAKRKSAVHDELWDGCKTRHQANLGFHI